MDGLVLDRLDAPVRRHRFDVDDVDRMIEAGILRPDDRIELIEGELLEMPADGSAHVWTVAKLNRLLMRALGDDAWVLVQSTVRLDQYNQPEPDVVIASAPVDWKRRQPPSGEGVRLMVEVSDSTFRFDSTVKRAMYARLGVPELWIVDIEGGAVEVAREPGPDGYGFVRRLVAGETVEPAAFSGMRFAVADILSGPG